MDDTQWTRGDGDCRAAEQNWGCVVSSLLGSGRSVPRPRPEELPMGPEEARGPEAENGGPGGQFWGKLRLDWGATADAAVLWCVVVLLCCDGCYAMLQYTTKY